MIECNAKEDIRLEDGAEGGVDTDYKRMVRGIKKPKEWQLMFRTACEKGYLEKVQYLVRTPDVPREYKKINGDGSLAWRMACNKGHIEIVKWLLLAEEVKEYPFDARVNRHIHANHGFFWACQRGHMEVLDWLTRGDELKAVEKKEWKAIEVKEIIQQDPVEFEKILRQYPAIGFWLVHTLWEDSDYKDQQWRVGKETEMDPLITSILEPMKRSLEEQRWLKNTLREKSQTGQDPSVSLEEENERELGKEEEMQIKKDRRL